MSAVPARGHMPFPGHRTQEQVRLGEEARMRRLRTDRTLRIAAEYGFEAEAQLPSKLA